MSASCSPSGRRGYTLLELIISMGVGAVVIAGLASALYVSSKCLAPDATATAAGSRSALALSQLTGDLRLATEFTERTALAVTFTVPDRTGDGIEESLRYSWSGTVGDPLLYQFNGGAAKTLLGSVQTFNLTALTRTIPAASIAPASVVTYQSFTEAKAATAATSLTISTPASVAAGNLLIAAVVVDGSVASSLAAGAGWSCLLTSSDSSGTVTMGVWWKIATGSEGASSTFSWTTSQRAYGWTMRFTGNELTAPVNAWSSIAGAAASAGPAAPSVTTTANNTMILRLGGFDLGAVTVDVPGVSGHTGITADRASTSTTGTSGAAAYATQATAGATGTASFTLTSAQRYITFTLAIAPDDGN